VFGTTTRYTAASTNTTRVGASADSTSNYYPFTDNLDNVRTMVTATGTTPAAAYTYGAYGATTSTSATLVQPYRYGSGYTHTATELIKTGIHYYDPIHGRFTQQDPTQQEKHPYLYAKGCPNTYDDPTGAGFKALGENLISEVFAEAVALTCVGTAALAIPATAGTSLVAAGAFCGGLATASGIAFNSFAFD